MDFGIINSTGRITDTQAMQQQTYESIGWDFTNIWRINNGYPYLWNEQSEPIPSESFGFIKVDGELKIITKIVTKVNGEKKQINKIIMKVDGALV